MKRWIHKLINQFNFEWEENPPPEVAADSPSPISEDRATLLYIIDTYNKHLLEVERHPVRKIREVLDEFAKELLVPDRPDQDKLLFRFRQFFGSYRIDEYSYIQKTFDDFRGIIWDFVDQLSEDLRLERTDDVEIKNSLGELREAVESNSIDLVKTQSRKFIDCYVEHQNRKDKRRTERIHSIKKNLDTVRKQLLEANQNMRLDHLTSAFNRKSFDEQLAQQVKMFALSPQPITLLTLDIDYFKRINDNYGHPVGDFCLKECVKTLNRIFSRSVDFVARIGGEEFAVILPEFGIEQAVAVAEQVLEVMRKEVYIHEGHQLRFTVSMGIARLQKGETADQWLKRADEALYRAKQTGRDRYTISASQPEITKVA